MVGEGQRDMPLFPPWGRYRSYSPLPVWFSTSLITLWSSMPLHCVSCFGFDGSVRSRRNQAVCKGLFGQSIEVSYAGRLALLIDTLCYSEV
ncbi:hypothetical protein GUJ93_ZPchr0069g33270 [Zizania palustris]|uniref:Uncharacterized protein n=1 Tax=Zizania palustris TaxID=103762 RepID=A0A8J5V358_ZIZPA|nr:hypothetical protein GUJ93_ZPchr0069g33270 [Zizania palustris]